MAVMEVYECVKSQAYHPYFRIGVKEEVENK